VKKGLAVLAIVAVVATATTATLIWRLTSTPAPKHPEISAYTHGQLVRVGPYKYCNVLNPTLCEVPKAMGELAVTSRNPVQLSVPEAIWVAPWVLLRAYEGPEDTIVETFAPKSKRAVTIPTVDARRGRLTGIAVELPTWARDEAGNEFPVPHAEWSVSTVWS
jgi:Protein of unknown function (DUF2771)